MEDVDKGEMRYRLNAYAKSSKHPMAGKFTDDDVEEVSHAVARGEDVSSAIRAYLGLEDFEEGSRRQWR